MRQSINYTLTFLSQRAGQSRQHSRLLFEDGLQKNDSNRKDSAQGEMGEAASVSDAVNASALYGNQAMDANTAPVTTE